LTLFNRFAVALAKSQDHRASCGVFAFGQRNAVRRWLRLRYPDTRASQIGERGLSLRARWLKQSEAVRCDDMAPKSNIEAQANFDFDHGKAVLCSNIHQRAIRNTYEAMQVWGIDTRTSMTNNRVAWTCNECGRYEQLEDQKCLNQALTDFGQLGLLAPEKAANQIV
jgi:hypothetical protein